MHAWTNFVDISGAGSLGDAVGGRTFSVLKRSEDWEEGFFAFFFLADGLGRDVPRSVVNYI
jgi:hypothetical protein